MHQRHSPDLGATLFHSEYPRKPRPLPKPPKEKKKKSSSSWSLWAGGVGGTLVLLLKLANMGIKADRLYGEHGDGSVSRTVRVVLGPGEVLDTLTSVEVKYEAERFTFPPPTKWDTLRFEARVHPLSVFPVFVVYHGRSGTKRTFRSRVLHGQDCLGAVNCVLYADTAKVECW